MRLSTFISRIASSSQNQAVVKARIEMTDSLTNVELSAAMYPSSQFIVHVAAWRKAQAAELKVCFR